MKLKEYIKHLNQIIKENPANADLEVIYSKDDEGNSYSSVNYLPTVGKFNFKHFEETETNKANAVCIN
jgi:hypothetical protein